jgi:glycosyltransferase involved in cell wall biosynthesis
MPLISIIIPCYNSARFLSETVASVRNQTVADWELILVDDGSRDKTGEMISTWAAQDARIQAIRKPNEGACRTRNRGFQACNPEAPYLFFFDHDDLIQPNFLEVMCAYIAAHPEVGLLACQFEDLSEDGKRLGTGGVSRWKPGMFFPHKMRDDEIETPFASFFSRTGRGPFAIYRRSVYERTTGWEVHFWPDEDTDMFCQMALLAKVHFIPDRLYLKRSVAGQGSQNPALLSDGYSKFRKKWDNRVPRDAREAALLRQAKHFLYRRYFPSLYLLGAARAVKSFLKTGHFREFRMELASNLASAFKGLFSPTREDR